MTTTLFNRIALRSAASLFLFLISLCNLQSQCTSSGPRSATSAASVSFSGSSFSFSNVNNIFSSDNNRASASGLLALLNGATEYLQATDFGFNIPSTAIICGVQVDAEKSATGIGSILGIGLSYVTDYSMRLVRNGTVVGNNKATGTHWTGAEAYHTYGGNTDIWGVAWTPADINNSNFGIAFSANIAGLLMLIPSVRIDHIRMTVYYYETLLPRTLFYFDARVKNDNAVMTAWKTSGEKSSEHYTVQRSKNGMQWENVAGDLQESIQGETTLYKLEDHQPYPGQSFYRLRIMQASGEKSYSGIRTVRTENNLIVKLYPNPFTDHVFISNINSNDPVSVSDVSGRLITLSHQLINNSTRKLNLQSLQPGLYFIKAGKQIFKIQKKE